MRRACSIITGKTFKSSLSKTTSAPISRHIGTRCHGCRYVCLGKDGGIVNPVADHHDFTPLFLQIFHISQLVFRRGFGTIGIQTQLLRDLGYGSLTVTA